MKRNIVTTIEFIDKKIAINVLEKIENNTIEIFHAKNEIKNASSFIKNSLRKINNVIKGKIKDVFIIIKPTKKNDAKIKLANNKIQVVNKHILDKDIDYLINSIKTKFKEKNKEIILIHPLQFFVENVVKKAYDQAPINIKGNYISTIVAITYISSKTYTYIKNIINIHNLNICQIFTTTQTISNNHLSNNAIYNGSVLVHFGHDQTFVSINKNGGTIDQFNIYNFGFNKLIYNVKDKFNCTYQEANNLILIYGTLELPKDEQIIFTKQKGIMEINYTNQELYKIIKEHFFKIIIIIKKYVFQKKIINIPFVISGKITKIDNILKFLKTSLWENIALYNPLQFLEINPNNENILGVLKINNFLNNVLEKNLTTIVKTNPNSFDYFFQKSKKSNNIFNKIFNKLGVNYEWNI